MVRWLNGLKLLRWVVPVGITLGVVLLVNLPIWWFYMFPKEGLMFLGRRVVNSQDMYTYVSYIEQAKQGSWLLENLYTTEAQTPSLIRPSYVVMGRFAAFFELPSVVTYHIFRVILSVIFCGVLYQLITVVFAKDNERCLAFVVVLSAAGVGAIFGKWFPSAVDLWVPEAFTFMSLGEAPHFVLAQILMLLGILSLIKLEHTKKWWYGVGVVMSWWPLAFEHPFDLLIMVPTMVVVLWQMRVIAHKWVVVLAGLSISGLGYAMWQQKYNALFAMEQAQGASISPSPMNYLLGFGLLLPIALVGVEKVWRGEKRFVTQFLVVWLVVGLLGIYAPVSFQRRMIEGVHMPLALLASMGLLAVYVKGQEFLRQLAKPMFIVVIISMMVTPLYLLYVDLVTIGKDSMESYYYYLSQADVRGVEWLAKNSGRGDVVATNWFYGNLLPGMIGRKVFLGHKAQTMQFDEKVKRINLFLLDEQVFSGKQFLEQNSIKYIFLGLGDTMLRYGFEPDKREYLEKVYDEAGVLVYRVKI